MTVKLGVVMDPIGSIKVAKDSTLAILLEAQARGWECWYLEQRNLALRGDRAEARMRRLQVFDDPGRWFDLGESRAGPLDQLHVVLMRKDPPFDMEYIFTTYILEHAERQGVVVVNRPRALRDGNEKLLITRFPLCIPPTLVTSSIAELRGFMEQQGEIVVKPLEGMGGAAVFRVRPEDPNTIVVLETVTGNGHRFTMAQRFIPEISRGDKRILLIDGEPVPHALARIPAEGDSRGNLAVGGLGHGVDLTDRDRWICQQVGPTLREMGLLFVGLDVIGDFLTEINVTSPTCIRELDRIYSLNISARLLDAIGARLRGRGPETRESPTFGLE